MLAILYRKTRLETNLPLVNQYSLTFRALFVSFHCNNLIFADLLLLMTITCMMFSYLCFMFGWDEFQDRFVPINSSALLLTDPFPTDVRGLHFFAAARIPAFVAPTSARVRACSPYLPYFRLTLPRLALLSPWLLLHLPCATSRRARPAVYTFLQSNCKCLAAGRHAAFRYENRG